MDVAGGIAAETAVRRINEMHMDVNKSFDGVENKIDVLLDAGSKHWEKTVQLEEQVAELTSKVDRLLSLLESKNKSICR